MMYRRTLPHALLVSAVAIITSISECSASSLTDVMDLYDALFVKSNYNRNVRGLTDQDGAIHVGANFSVVSLGEVMEREEAFSVMGLLYLTWTDERLVWNASEYNGTLQMVVYQEEIWKPEVKLANPMLAVYALGGERTQVRIRNTGQVTWIIPDMYTATCDIDVVSFPWDRQSCSLDFIVSTYVASEVTIKAESNQVDVFEDSEQWAVLQTNVENIVAIISKVRFWLCLERRPSFHLSVIFIPIVALSILNVFVYFIKVDSGERISFAITLFLSITLYLSMVADRLPMHSKGMSSIIYCLNFVLAESMGICIMSIYSLHVYHKPGVPSVTCQRIVMKLLGCRCNKVGHADTTDPGNAFTDDDSECKKNHIVESVVESDLGITWMDVSLLIDRVCTCLAVLAILLSFVIFATFVVFSKTECI